jgi:very-short-patch-repair endonuclease
MQRRRQAFGSYSSWYARRDKLTLARQMRQQPTQAEAQLWSRLRARQLDGLKFRRQHIIAGYIADFYCPAIQLAVEVDGPHHQYQQQQDEFRTEVLAQCGVRVVRVSADAVMNNLDEVLRYIRNVIAEDAALFDECMSMLRR